MSSLVLNGESLDEVSLAGRCRTAAIKALCSMHPSRAAMVQSLSVANCKHPTLALSIALEAEERKMRYIYTDEKIASFTLSYYDKSVLCRNLCFKSL